VDSPGGGGTVDGVTGLVPWPFVPGDEAYKIIVIDKISIICKIINTTVHFYIHVHVIQ
jgi:hypothetical protein